MGVGYPPWGDGWGWWIKTKLNQALTFKQKHHIYRWIYSANYDTGRRITLEMDTI